MSIWWTRHGNGTAKTYAIEGVLFLATCAIISVCVLIYSLMLLVEHLLPAGGS